MTIRTNDINNGRQVYLRLLSYVRPYTHAFIFACCGLVVYAGTDALLAWVIKPMIDGSFVEKDEFWIAMIPPLLIILALVRGLSSFTGNFLVNWVGQHVIKQLRYQIFDKLLVLPSAFFDQNNTGELLSKVIYDVAQVAQASTQAITVMIRDTLTIVFLLGLMFYYNWQLTISFMVISPIVAILIVYVNRRFRRISTNIQDAMGSVTHIAEEAISSQKVIKIFGGQGQEQGRFDRVNERNRLQNMKFIATREASLQLIQLIAAISLAAIVFLATLPSLLDSITPGTFTSFIAAMMMLLSPIKRLTTINAEIQRGIAAASSIFGLLDQTAEPNTGTVTLKRALGDVEFRQVSFSYGRSESLALDDINIHIRPGQTVAFVGHSGSGKTTLANMVPRFIVPDSGHIFIDGHDINTMDLVNLRQQIALVGQDVVLFNDTIGANICYGQTVDVERLSNAARAAHAIEFIEQLPQGMDTEIGEKGVLLSGGQRQRLAIARALYKNAPLLILDEATSALDSASERYIQQALETLVKNRTTLVIAHRLSTIQNADQIIVLQDGRIVEAGCHDELLALNKYYARLYHVQLNTNHPTDT